MAALGFNQYYSLFPPATTGFNLHHSLFPPARPPTYQLLNVISQGSYGVVYRALDTKTSEIVAVKKEFHGLSKTTQREINILKGLPRHPFIVEFKDLIVYDQQRVFVVMEYVESDLCKLMNLRKIASTRFNLSEIKMFMKKLLKGVAFLHDNGVMHRDLKPSNILVNEIKGDLKICDFGLSRCFDRTKETGRYTQRVGTLWYKAPELLLGAKEYSCAVDMWSVGCIMAELLLNRVLFQGSCEIRQIASIYKVLGMPDDVALPGFSNLPGSGVVVEPLGERLPCNLLDSGVFAGHPLVTEHCFDLILKLLKYDPKKRITAKEALDHGWFKESYGLSVDLNL
ncbi:hypothetical protein CASFOL_037674 [Castilleja foliolosa]|uniref:Protein kinase domain-containing protein n=1 Tax=Castilleja foliolosa TaxID=1961234 RepID=A0ABD3BMU7_9LAMI